MPEVPRPHAEVRFQRTPELAALFHQIRYDVNNKGVKPENLNDYSYLRVFAQMGEEYALHRLSQESGLNSNPERALKLQGFGKDGFAIVVEVAKEIAGISGDEEVPREDKRLGLYKYTSLSPFIESLEESGQQPSGQDKKELQAYLSSLQDEISADPLFAREGG